MADQASVDRQTELDSNGRRHVKRVDVPRGVAGGVSDLVHDVTSLAELQVQLARADLKAVARRFILPAVGLILGACLALGALPVLLLALSAFLANNTDLSLAMSRLIVGGAGLIVATAMMLLGIWGIYRSVRPLSRSMQELSQNVQWLKANLLRQGTGHRGQATGR